MGKTQSSMHRESTAEQFSENKWWNPDLLYSRSHCYPAKQIRFKLVFKGKPAAYIHIYTECPYYQVSERFLEILCNSLRGAVLTNCSINGQVHNGQISRKVKESKFSVNVHIHLQIVSFLPSKFYEILCSSLRGVVQTNKQDLTDHDWLTNQMTDG